MAPSMLILLVLSLGVGTIWTACILIYRMFHHPLSKFPGPRLAAATFGYEIYYDVFKSPGGQYNYKIQELHRKYGPIIRINPEEVHISDPEWFDVLYAGPGHIRDRSVRTNRGNGSVGSVASSLEHDVHRARRSSINPYFSKAAINQLGYQVWEAFELLGAKMAERADSGEIVNLGAALGAVTMDVVTRYVYDEAWHVLKTPDLGVQWNQVMLEGFSQAPLRKHIPAIASIMSSIPLWLIKRLNANAGVFVTAKQRADAVSHRVWKEIQASRGGVSEKQLDDRRPRTVFHGIMNSNLRSVDKSMDRLADEAFVLVMAGGETTAKVTLVTLVHLLQDPSLLAQLRGLLDGVMKAGRPSYRDLEAVPLMKAIVQEGVRLACPVMNRATQMAPKEDMTLNGIVIPRGDVCFDEKIFPDPYHFNPSRWLQAAERGERLEKYLISFSRGSRACVGMELALCEMYIGLATLICNFDLQLIDFDYERDLATVRDGFVGLPSKESRGVQVRVGVRRL
ncbi:hypothetical protein LTR78_010779 [Recurvomyces mirabilis]|uniref:Cytochrome P450 n=1 Tax=Recurvomyces mirabilis TaxID=574656 RepID=A0AAE0TP65_9PEZI|nr:hypothetical protein LTR78_010779 [Recurvomyces mirabilis]KAK5162358.1 hypothetical protein LTS14_000705 [Recurvomyces mirabilis]